MLKSPPTDLHDHLRLIRSRGIGPISYRHLMQRFGSASEAIAMIPELARRGRGRPPRLADPREVEAEMREVERHGAHYLLIGTPAYPALLAEIDGAPPVITVKGRSDLLDRPAIAMVGARNASAAACRFARQLAHDLGGAGQVVVSGLARGIDSAAHDGALPTGTVAVIAGGIDIAYPPENAARQEDIAEQGLVVAEMPPGTKPTARHFPNRNRIISGLCAGTVVVEAAPRSGSLITARLAGEQGREVMAVPGSPLDPRARGCNGLIRDGAVLVQDVEDVLATLRPIDARMEHVAEERAPAPIAEDVDAAASERVEALLGPVAVGVDEIIRQSGLTPPEVQLALLELDLGGRLDRHAGGKVSLR
ncbi:DNA-processing protein DprA [Sphingomicrobium aestuariivivum]|nr:DNA-processing protein DprA [Sphingomicrobium aestuariivivum]MCJ8190153.1 DNA-processing protein DprA [Sphingomicrobium aestuariivivum]